MSLVIERTNAQIHIQTTPSQLSMQTKNASLQLTHKEARVDVHTELPRVEIDQYECFATSGLMNVFDLTREAAQAAMQQALTYAGKVSGDGDTMAAIENKGNPIPAMAERDANPEKVFEIDYMPKARPKITVRGGVTIQSQNNNAGVNNGVEGNYTPGGVNFNFTPAKVNISMAQYASLNIRNAGKGFNAYA